MDSNIDASALKVLNEHGHSFHQALMRRLDTAYRTDQSPYRFVVSEYPVAVGDKHTAIDFILQRAPTWDQVVVAECKRVDPARGWWLFARSQYTSTVANPKSAYVSMVRFNSSSGRLQEQTHEVPDATPYHLAFDMKTGLPGTGIGTHKSAIELAVSQVFLGTAGLIEALSSEPELLLTVEVPTLVLPVVFTTAKLFVVDDELAAADVLTGDLSRANAREVPFLWYQTNLTRSLRPRVQPEHRNPDPSLERVILYRHTRATMVVKAERDGLLGFIDTAKRLRTEHL